MNNQIITTSKIPKTIKYIENIIIAIILMAISLQLYFNGGINSPPSLLPDWFVFLALLICAGLSWIFPTHSSLWQRRLYILTELALIVLTKLTGWGLEILIFVLISKACFLLPKKDVIWTTIITGFCLYSLEIYNDLSRLPMLIKFWRSQIEKLESIYTPQRVFAVIIANNLLVYIAGSIFVILFSYVLISEQKNRQKAEYLAKEVEDLATQLERNRIARDIHDSLGHRLTNLDIQLELGQRLRTRDPQQALQILDNAKELSIQCLQEVRRAVQTMRSEEFNLNNAIQELAQSVQQNQFFQLQLNMDLPKLSLQTSHQLYCLVQEALTNIQKHAYAQHVNLRGYINHESQSLCLEITDDGQGFNPNAPTMGFGLWGMKERIKILEGELIIHSIPNSGTQIKIFIPLLKIA